MQERFQQAAAPSLEMDGRTVWAIYDLPVPADRGRVQFESVAGERAQGVALASSGSPLEVNGATANDIRLWSDTAPELIEFGVSDRSRLQRLRVWNVWRTRHGAEDAWTGNFGMWVEQSGTSFRFHCSDGIGDVDFGDLVFRIEF
jgi:hypothetical protein